MIIWHRKRAGAIIFPRYLKTGGKCRIKKSDKGEFMTFYQELQLNHNNYKKIPQKCNNLFCSNSSRGVHFIYLQFRRVVLWNSLNQCILSFLWYASIKIYCFYFSYVYLWIEFYNKWIYWPLFFNCCNIFIVYFNV